MATPKKTATKKAPKKVIEQVKSESEIKPPTFSATGVCSIHEPTPEDIMRNKIWEQAGVILKLERKVKKYKKALRLIIN